MNAEEKKILDILLKVFQNMGSQLGGSTLTYPTKHVNVDKDLSLFSDAFKQTYADALKKLIESEDRLKKDVSNSRTKNDLESAFGDRKSSLEAWSNTLQDAIKDLINQQNNAKDQTEKDKFQKKIDATKQQLLDIKAATDELSEDLTESIEKLTGGAVAALNSKSASSLMNFGKRFNVLGDSINTLSNGKLKGLSSAFGKAGGAISKFAGSAAIPLAVLDHVDKAFAACAQKAMEYQNLKLDNYIRSITAESKLYINSMNTGLTAWKNAVEGATGALDARIEGEVGMAKAAAENALATQKFEHSLWNWVPILGTLNKIADARKERMIKEANTELELAQQRLKVKENYVKQIDDYAKTIDKSQRTYQRMVGITDAQMSSFRNNMYNATAVIAEFGKTQEDLLKSRSAFVEGSGRNIEWTQSDAVRSMAVGSLIGQDTMDQFAASMVLFNTSVKDSANIMEDVYKDANKMGVSSQKLTKNVLNNLKLAHQYNFKNGVEGFIKAAKWAETARYDMSVLGATLDKIQEGGLEGVLQQSAQLQVLGGNAAMGADPISMMYNAYNDPEAYARMQQNALKNFGHINARTGETQFNMADQMQIGAIAKAYGLSKEQAMEMARASNKRSALENVNRNLRGEDMDAVANRAQFNKQTKQWEVTMIGGKTKNVSELTAADMDKIEPEDTRSAEEIAKATLNTEEKSLAVLEQISNMLAASGGFDEYLKYADEATNITKEGMAGMADSILSWQDNLHASSLDTLRVDYITANATQSAADDLETIKSMQYTLNKTDLEKAAWKDYKKEHKGENIGNILAGIGAGAAAGAAGGAAFMGIGAVPGAIIGGLVGGAGGLGVSRHIMKENFRKGYYDGVYQGGEGKDLAKGVAASVNGKEGPANEYKAITNVTSGNTYTRNTGTHIYNSALNDTTTNSSNFSRRGTNIYNSAINGGTTTNNSSLSNTVVPIISNELPERTRVVGGGVVGGVTTNNNSNVVNNSRYEEREAFRSANNTIKLEPVDIRLNGSLTLNCQGQQIDIIKELQNNQELLKQLSQMISSEMSKALNGGKSVTWNGRFGK